MKKIISPLLFVACFILLSGCSQKVTDSGPSSQPATQILKVGISTNSPPMAFRSKGVITGLEADLARGLAQFSGKQVKFVSLKWKDQIPSLLSGKIDIIMSAMTITSAREYRVAFCKPYMATGQIALVRGREENKFSDGLPSLLNQTVRVGTVKGTTGDLLIEKSKAKGKRTQFLSSKKAVQSLLNNDIDAFVYDLPGNLYYGSIYADKGLVPVMQPMTREQIAWAVRKEDSLLLQTANNYLATSQQNGSLKKMILHWVPFYKTLYNR